MAKQRLGKSHGRKEAVIVNMVLLSVQLFRQSFDDVLPYGLSILPVVFLPKVYLKLMTIASLTIRPHPDLNSPPGGLRGDVLLRLHKHISFTSREINALLYFKLLLLSKILIKGEKCVI